MRGGVGHWILVKSGGTGVSHKSNDKSRKENKGRRGVNSGERWEDKGKGK